MPYNALTEFTVNDTTALGQQYSSVTRLSDGAIVVTWTDYNTAAGDGTGSCIRAKILEANGTVRTPEFTVNQTATGSQYVSAVVALQDGGFAVTWQNFDTTTTVSAIAFDEDGNVTMAQQDMPGTDGLGTSPDITQLTTGELVISYTAARPDPMQGNDAIVAVISNYATAPAVSQYQITNEPGVNQADVAVTALPGGGFTAAFFQDGDLLIQSYTAPGIAMAGSFVAIPGGGATVGGGNDLRPSIHTLNDGKVLVMWSGNGNYSDGDGSGVMATLYATDGSITTTQVNLSEFNDQSYVSFAQISATEIVAVWYDLSASADGSLSAIKGRMLSYNGAAITPSGGEFIVNSSTYGDQWVPVVTATGSGGFLVSWTDVQGSISTSTATADVKARFYEPVPPNAAPEITSLEGLAFTTATVRPGQTFVVDSSASDSNAGDTQTWSISGGADAALFTINGQTGVLSFTSAQDIGNYDVEITVTDQGGLTDTQNITVSVENTLPAVRDDFIKVVTNSPTLITGLFNNDTDAESGQLSFGDFTGIGLTPLHGEIVDNNDGTFTYTPDAGYTGTDSFSYGMADTNGGFDSAVVHISVGANEAPRFNIGHASSAITTSGGYAEAQKMVHDTATGAYYVAGFASPGAPTGYSMAVTKFNADGSVDVTFGSNGVVLLSSPANAEAYDMALDADGNLIIAGVTTSTPVASFAVVKLLPSGAPDATFGTGGIVTAAPYSGAGIGDTVLIQPADGKIIVTGHGGAGNFLLMRFNTDGTPDSTFGFGGTVETDIGDLNQPDQSSHAILAPDGKIIVVGSTFNGTDTDTAIARYNADGSLDTTFNATGFRPGTDVLDVSPLGDHAHAVATLADGTIVLAGFAGASAFYTGNSNLMLMRYNTDGSVEVAEHDLEFSEVGRSIAVQPDGKVLVAGFIYGGLGNVQFAVARMDSATGNLDTTFGNGAGYVLSDFAAGQGGVASSVAVDSLGRILVSGTSADLNFVIFRLESDGTPDTGFGQESTLGGSVTHVVGDTATVMDSSVEVFDAELDQNDDYGGATLTLARSGGANADDDFAGTGNLGPLADGNDLILGENSIGEVAFTGGQLVLTFWPGVTRADVSEVLSSLAYKYTGTGVPPVQVDIEWTFSDGGPGAPQSAIGQTTIYLTPGAGPSTFTFDWSDRETKLTTSDPDSLANIIFDATDPLPNGTITEVQTDTSTQTDTVAHLIEGAGGPLSYSQTDNFIITGTPHAYDTITYAQFGNDTIITADGNDVVTPGGGADSINTGGGADIVRLITPASAGDTHRQTFTSNSFDGGAGTDQLHVSGEFVDAGGDSSLSGDGLTRALLGFEELHFTTDSGDWYNTVSLRLQDVTDSDGIHMIFGSSISDYLIIRPELGESYGPSVTIDISGLVFTDWSTGPDPDQIRVEGTGGSDTITGNSAGFNLLYGWDGADIIYGGNGGNYISGGLGNDELYGGLGSDTLAGNEGADDIYGTPGGDDYVDYSASSAGVTVNLLTNVNTGGDAAGDRLYNILGITGSSHADSLTGNSQANVISGGLGADTIYGKDGNDVLFGGDGNDNLIGEDGDDTIYGEDGKDTLQGRDGDDTLYGGAGADRFYGGLGADEMFGTVGESDAAYYTTSADAVTINLADNSQNHFGEAEGDILHDIQWVYGSNQGDDITGNSATNRLMGMAGNDTLRGGGGDDILEGGAGSDTLHGGTGKDELYGGADSDTFYFESGDTGQTSSAWDTVTDYSKGAVGVGDEFAFEVDLVIGGSSAAATSAQASINATTGVATFAAGSGRKLPDALSDIATRFTASGDQEGEFALFRLADAGDYYLFISDGSAGVTAGDSVVRIAGVTTVASINLTDGDLTLLA
jgi:uncharacterized delta-60 repeat protein